jgi:hypothetical protein
MVLPSYGPIKISDIKKEYNGDYPCPGCKDMRGYDDSPGADQGAPNQFGYLNDYPSAISQGFTDSDIRCYIEKVYKFIPGKVIGPDMQEKLDDVTWGVISAGINSIGINTYYRNPSGIITDTYYVKSTLAGSIYHPNTVNIPTSGTIRFSEFRDSYSVIGFNRYYSRLYNSSGLGLHFYTATPNNESLGSPNFYDLQVQNYFYIHGGPVFSNTVPLHRFATPDGAHLFTLDKSEGTDAGYSYENIVGYAYTSSGLNLYAIYQGRSTNGVTAPALPASPVSLNNIIYSYNKGSIESDGYVGIKTAFYAYQDTDWRRNS